METSLSLWPLAILLLGTLSVVFFIVALRFPAFIALMLSAVVVGFLTPVEASQGNAWVAAIEDAMREFGVTAGKVSFVIAIASVLGVAMTKSGAAEKIVNALIHVFGEKRAGLALLVAGFILSIPVFFDTVFFLLIPLGIVLAQKTERHFLLYAMAISCGAVITHSLIPPTPGPLLMAESLDINLGLIIGVGLITGILPAVAGYKFAQRQDLKMPIAPPLLQEEDQGDDERRLPSFVMSMLPIALPLLLIVIASLLSVLRPDHSDGFSKGLMFLGNKNVAMFIGLLVAMHLWAKQKNLGFRQLGTHMEKPLQIAGLIILITSAGGAFGAMIRHTGIGEMIQAMTENGLSINLVLVAWVMAVVIKFAQGSGTVSVITTAGIMAAIVGTGATLPYHPIYLFLAIGYGSMVGSWMNDSGFWIITRMSGMSETEGLKYISPMTATMGVAGLLTVIASMTLFPMI